MQLVALPFAFWPAGRCRVPDHRRRFCLVGQMSLITRQMTTGSASPPDLNISMPRALMGARQSASGGMRQQLCLPELHWRPLSLSWLARTALPDGLGRPARQVQWSIGLQRELPLNLLVGGYVGNHGAYWNAGYIINPNAISGAGS